MWRKARLPAAKTLVIKELSCGQRLNSHLASVMVFMGTKEILHWDEGYNGDSKQGLLLNWEVQHAAFLSHNHYHKNVVWACVYTRAQAGKESKFNCSTFRFQKTEKCGEPQTKRPETLPPKRQNNDPQKQNSTKRLFLLGLVICAHSIKELH